VLIYTIIEPGKTTTYEGITKTWPQKGPPEAIALLADEDVVDYFVLDHPSQTNGVEAYIADTPCSQLLGVYVPYYDEIQVDLSDVRAADFDVVKAIMHRLPRHLQIAFKALLPT
jgi:hypothetical protein